MAGIFDTKCSDFFVPFYMEARAKDFLQTLMIVGYFIDLIGRIFIINSYSVSAVLHAPVQTHTRLTSGPSVNDIKVCILQAVTTRIFLSPLSIVTAFFRDS